MEIHERHADQAPALGNANKARKIQKRGPEAKRQALYRMSGADLTQIDAIGVETVEMVIREYGPDLSCFPTEKQFVAHATRAPHVAQSGGRPLPKKRRRGTSPRVANALRLAALWLRHSDTALGAYYRNLAHRLGGDVAVFATARKLGTLILPLAALGTALRGSRRGGLRTTLSTMGCQNPDRQG